MDQEPLAELEGQGSPEGPLCRQDSGMRVRPAAITPLPVPRPPRRLEVHLLWRCPRRSARWCPSRSAPSGTGPEGTGLTCARGPWSGPCTLARGAGEGSCIPRGCRSEGERTGPKRKAEPLCQGQRLLPDYPVESQRWREGEKSVSGHRADPFPRAPGHSARGRHCAKSPRWRHPG